jgi:23S rRNA (guanosine2251-2'-O)-methyltransferase
MMVIRECTNQECLFRFPDVNSNQETFYCPKCGELTRICEELQPRSVFYNDKSDTHFGERILILLDNIRSIYNAGSIFRTADGFGIPKIECCGITPTPQNPRFAKTSLGAENHVRWEYHLNAVIACQSLLKQGYQLIALENPNDSVSIYSLKKDQLTNKCVLILGNEKTGVDPAILRLSQLTVSIPMHGYKDSFNVATAFGIAVSYLYSLFSI